MLDLPYRTPLTLSLLLPHECLQSYLVGPQIPSDLPVLPPYSPWLSRRFVSNQRLLGRLGRPAARQVVESLSRQHSQKRNHPTWSLPFLLFLQSGVPSGHEPQPRTLSLEKLAKHYFWSYFSLDDLLKIRDPRVFALNKQIR